MLFSIITVSFNAEKTIAATLDSILEQGIEDIEVIVIDGASTDGTVNMLHQYKGSFHGKLRWQSEPDNGIYDAMNKGVALAQGEFVNFLNCGDSYLPKALANVAETIRLHPKTQVAYGIARYFDDRGEVRLIRECHTRFRERNICHQSIWYKRDLFDKYGMYDLAYRYLADYDLNIRLFQAGVLFCPVDAIVVNYSLEGVSSAPDNSEAGQKEAMTIFYRHKMVDHAHYKWFMGSFTRRRFFSALRTMARKCYLLFSRSKQ